MADLLRLRIASALVAASILAGGALAHLSARQGGQTPPPSAPATSTDRQPPTIRTGTELVRVDVSVMDRRGQPVRTLTADDFEVFEDDEPQSIQSFKFVALTGAPAEGDELSLPIRSRDHAAAEAAKDEVRVFLIFWDEYHIGRMTSAVRAREALMRFVRNAFGPTDLVGFMDPLTPTDAIRFTREPLELFETARHLRGRSGEYVPARSVAEEAHLRQMRSIERLRSEVTVSALKAAAVHLGAIRQGRKAIILISEGLRGLGRDEPPLIMDLIRTANDNNTAIYTINPLGLTVRRSYQFGMLEALAVNTGADYSSSNDFSGALQKVVNQATGVYLLGYAPAERRFDGLFHRIRVRVKRPGLTVRARAGYWAPTVADLTREATRAAGSELPPVVARGFGELTPSSARRTIDVWIGTGVRGDGGAEVRVAWLPRERPAALDLIEPRRAFIAAVRGEEEIFDGEIPPGGLAFPASPGPLRLTITATDEAGDIIDRATRTVEVPDPAAGGLWMSSPVVFRTNTAREVREVAEDPSPPPYAGRDLERTDRLFIRFATHGAARFVASVAARLLNRSGDPIATLPVMRRAPQGGTYEIDLPLGSMARGEYLVLIEGAHASERVEAAVPIRIVR